MQYLDVYAVLAGRPTRPRVVGSYIFCSDNARCFRPCEVWGEPSRAHTYRAAQQDEPCWVSCKLLTVIGDSIMSTLCELETEQPAVTRNVTHSAVSVQHCLSSVAHNLQGNTKPMGPVICAPENACDPGHRDVPVH